MREEDYIIRIAGSVRNFKRVGTSKYQLSCPVCGDSTKVRSKARGSLFIYKGDWMYHCYNCGVSYGFRIFLKNNFPDMYKDYIFDQFNHSKKSRKKVEPLKVGTKKPEFRKVKTFTSLDEIISLKDNPDHRASKYLLDRGLTMDMINGLFFTENFRVFVNSHLIKDKFTKPENIDPRIIIPFLNDHNKLLGVQGRALDPDAFVRYISIKIVHEDEQLIYGLDKIDFKKPVFVVEGPFDSMFIPNAVAWGGGALHTIKGLKDPILVWDNEPRNKQINDQTQKAIDKGFRIVVWPKRNTEKDINDMINANIKVDDTYLLTNSYQGLSAQLKFDQWRKT